MKIIFFVIYDNFYFSFFLLFFSHSFFPFLSAGQCHAAAVDQSLSPPPLSLSLSLSLPFNVFPL